MSTTEQQTPKLQTPFLLHLLSTHPSPSHLLPYISSPLKTRIAYLSSSSSETTTTETDVFSLLTWDASQAEVVRDRVDRWVLSGCGPVSVMDNGRGVVYRMVDTDQGVGGLEGGVLFGNDDVDDECTDSMGMVIYISESLDVNTPNWKYHNIVPVTGSYNKFVEDGGWCLDVEEAVRVWEEERGVAERVAGGGNGDGEENVEGSETVITPKGKKFAVKEETVASKEEKEYWSMYDDVRGDGTGENGVKKATPSVKEKEGEEEEEDDDDYWGAYDAEMAKAPELYSL